MDAQPSANNSLAQGGESVKPERGMMNQLIVDPELKALIPPLSGEERTALENSILTEGCRDAIVTWQGVIVDGHNRYEICQRHSLPFQTVEHSFDDRNAVIVWMIQNQLARRNITQHMRGVLALRMKDVIAAQAKANQKGGQGGVLLPQNSAEAKPIETRAELARMAETSHDTIRKIERIEQDAPEPIKQAARSGELSTDRAYKITQALKDAPAPVLAVVESYGIDDPHTVAIIKRLHASQSDTLTEIQSSGYIQPGEEEEAVHITDGAIAVDAALKLKSKIHAQMAMDEKRQNRQDAAQKLTLPTDYIKGDCLGVIATLPASTVRLLLTDPPYGQNFQSNRRVATAKASKIENDDSLESAIQLMAAMLEVADRVLMPDAHLLIFTSWRYEPQFRAVIEGAGYSIDGSLVWVKENHGSGDLTAFAPRHERIIHARRGKVEVSPRIDDVQHARRGNVTSHPTEKPVDLLARLIESTTVTGEFVLDPFAGTGATVAAARKTMRKAIGIELSGEWYDDGVLRLNSDKEAWRESI